MRFPGMLGLLAGNPAMSAAAHGMGTPPPGTQPPPAGMGIMGGGGQPQAFTQQQQQRLLDTLAPPEPLRLPAIPQTVPRDPQAQLGQARTMARQLMGPAPRMISAPQLRTPQLSDAEVQGQIPQQNPLERARAASSAGEIRYEEPDFLARPEGEAELEDFAWRRMVSMGSHAPPAMVQQWQGIQRAKQVRMDQRARYFSTLIADRHRADLQFRNQSSADNARATQNALQRSAEMAFRGARLKMEARAANQRERNRYNMQLAGTTQAIMGSMNTSPEDIRKVVKEVQPRFDQNVAALQEVIDMNRYVTEAGDFGGAPGRAWDYLKRQIGSEKAIEAQRSLNAIASRIRSSLAEGNSRLFDSEGDMRFFMSTQGNVGNMNQHALRRFLRLTARATTRLMESDLRYLSLTPGAAEHVGQSMFGIVDQFNDFATANAFQIQAREARAGEIAAGDVRPQ